MVVSFKMTSLILKVGRIDGRCTPLSDRCKKLKNKAFSRQLEIPRGLPSLQTFQEHVGSYLCLWHQEYSVFIQVHQLPCTSWSEVWRACIESLDVNGVLARSYVVIEVEVVESTIEH